MVHRYIKTTLSFTVFSMVGLIVLSFFNLYTTTRNEFLSGKNLLYKNGSVLGSSIESSLVNVDFGKQISSGSPLVFGGAHNPAITHLDAWNKITDAGVTSIRTDFYIDQFLPFGLSVEKYKSDVKNVQNPNNWRQEAIAPRKQVFEEAKKRGITTFGILSYSTNWLSSSNTIYGVPKDWNVYKDIVKKSYSLFRKNVDYIEVWNEPTISQFLDLKGSGATRKQAYQQIFRVAVEAIHEADDEANDGHKVKIGAPAADNPNDTSLLEAVFEDPSLRDSVDFVSYHNYVLEEPSWNSYKNILKKYNKEELPIYITEWNYTSKREVAKSFIQSNQIVPFTAKKISNFLKMGIQGASYLNLDPINISNPKGDQGFFGFYSENGTTATLQPAANTWKLMSKSLSLGKGPSKIFATSDTNIGSSLAFQNSAGVRGFVLVNDQDTTREVILSINNSPFSGNVYLKSYLASNSSDGSSVQGIISLEPKNMNSFTVFVPSQSVVGVEITGDISIQEKIKYLFLPNFISK